MPTNDGTVDDPHRVGFNGAKDFITCLHGISLRPLRSMDKSSSEFSADLEGYLSVLDRGGSIASGRGHELASVRLGKLLETLFLTPTPSVREGPPLTWATVVLFAGPHFEGPSKLKIGESLVELPESDLGLLSSGRPWRFLYPWPDKDDCEKELRSIETALQELNNTRQTIHEVLRKMLVVEQRLTNHHDVVAQLLQDEPQAALQRKTLEFGRDRANPPNEAASNVGTSDARVPREDAVSDSYQPPLPQEVHERCSNQSIQPTIEELRDKGEAGDSVSGNSMQHENPQPMTITGERSRLHLSDFIQTLSDILDDPRNTDAMHWSEDGRALVLAQENKFPEHLLARISTKTYKSLVRRLYYYGFRKIGGAYRHAQFIRGQPSSILPAHQESHSPSLPRLRIIASLDLVLDGK